MTDKKLHYSDTEVMKMECIKGSKKFFLLFSKAVMKKGSVKFRLNQNKMQYSNKH